METEIEEKYNELKEEYVWLWNQYCNLLKLFKYGNKN